MREPLTKLESDLAKQCVANAEERDRLRRAIARALKALDAGDVSEGRMILFNAL